MSGSISRHQIQPQPVNSEPDPGSQISDISTDSIPAVEKQIGKGEEGATHVERAIVEISLQRGPWWIAEGLLPIPTSRLFEVASRFGRLG